MEKIDLRTKMIINKKALLIVFLLAGVFHRGNAQNAQYVTEQNIASLTGNLNLTDSYYFTKSVTITATPGNSVTISSASGNKFITFLPTNPPPSPNENYVRVEVPKVPVTNETDLTTLSANDKTVTYTYSDDLGRPLMTSVAEAGPNYEDLVQPNYYNSNTGIPDQSYLPFTTNSTNPGGFINEAYTSTGSYYENPPTGVAQDLTPYAEVDLEDSPMSRPKSQMGVGSDWRNIEFPENNLDADVDYFLNDGSMSIPNWVLDANGNPARPVGNDEHSDFTLHIVETVNEDGIKSQSITDSRGRNIATRTWFDDSGTARWITTYYVYDMFNRLRWILPPAISTKTSITSTELTNLAFEYKYDYRGRLNYEKNPGIEEVIYIYDNRNRLVYSQNGEQRNIGQWTYRKYDRYNRTIMTGLYTGGATQSSLEAQLRGASDLEMYEIRNNTHADGYTNTTSFPKSGTEIMAITFYDDYDFKNSGEWPGTTFNYNNSVSGISLPSSAHGNILGLSTGSRVKVIGSSNDWLNSIIYYDDEYRALQIVSENHVGGHDRISNQLDDYTGILEKMKLEHVGYENVDVLSEYTYDHEFRLLQTHQQINSDPKVLVADYQYNALGQMIEKNLHSTDNGNSFLQSVDYRYNIRGWLSSINNDRLSETESKAQPDIFGANLYYTSPPSVNGSRENRYDGRMAVFSWDADNLQGKEFNRPATEYIYDDLGRLDETDYGADGIWANGAPNADHYEINVGYDDQGNIESMERKSEGSVVDNLTYTYQDNSTSNKLEHVADNSGNSAGFNDRIPSVMPNEYMYDSNGNLTRDQHKAMSISYNYLQLASSVIFDDGRRIDYTYDATGNRLSKTVTFADGKTERMDYVGLVEYLDDEIYQLYTDEGRAFKQNDQYFYEYYIADHQGNNRAAFGILPERNVYKANMEEGPADNQFAFPSNDPRLPGENRTTGGAKSTHLNHALSRSLGPAKVLSIKKDDEVEIEFWAKYASAAGTSGTFIDVVETLISGLGYSSTDGGAGESISNNVGSGGTFAYIPSSTSNPNDAPDAYLAYLFFDQNYSFDPTKSSFVKVESQSLNAYARYDAPKLTFDEDGYLFVYLANETQEDQEVYFDDLRIVHESPTAEFKVSQINEYYPFGLLTKNSWRNPGYEDPGMLYQSYYATYDSLTEYNDFFLRNYDPAIGRWMQSDPYSQFASPYLAMSNNPHSHIDPDGGWDPFGDAIKNWLEQKATEYIGGSIYSALEGNSRWYDPGSWSQNANIASNFGHIAVGAISSIASSLDVEFKVFKAPRANTGSPQDRRHNNNRLRINASIKFRGADFELETVTLTGIPFERRDTGFEQGLNARFGFTVPNRGDYSQYNIIQTVTTNAPDHVSGESPYVDGQNDPFYWNDDIARGFQINANREGFDFISHDKPARHPKSTRELDGSLHNVKWMAELSLMGKNVVTGNWERLGTWSYGFQLTPTATSKWTHRNEITPFKPIKMSRYTRIHRRAIKRANQ